MKKVILAVLTVALAAGTALAYGKGGERGERAYRGCGGYEQGCGNYDGEGRKGEFKQVTAEEAKASLEKYIKENFKGYKIEKIDKFVMPRGESYQATVTDAGGNTFYFHVRGNGSVAGPIIAR
jgi:hypothetical protein